MKVIAKPRGTGKTRELFALAAQNNGQVLTTNKRAMRAKADNYGWYDLSILDWNDLLYGEYDKNKPLYIDNAEDVFAELLDNDFELKLEGLNVNLED